MPYYRCIFPALLCLFGFRATHAQPALNVRVLDKPIIVDGKITPEEWQPAGSVSGFYQLEPEKGSSASRKTTVLAGQYGKNLYFAFICLLDEPAEAVARIQRRDQLDESDDIVSVLLDTYNDFLEGKNNVFWSQAGALRSWYLTYRARMYMSNRFSLEVAYNDEYKLLDKDYYNHFYRAAIGFNTDEASNIELGYQTGRNFGRDFQLWQLMLRFQLFSRLALSYELNRLDYQPDPTAASTTINVLGADFFFNKDLWVRVFTQNNSVSDKFYFYGLFGWRFRPPFGAVYLIVSTDRFAQPLQLENIRSEIVFLKLTYPVSIL